MTDKYVITTSGDNAGEKLREKLAKLDYEIEDVIESQVTLTIESSNGTEEKDLSEKLESLSETKERDPEKADMEVPCLDPTTKMFHFLQVLHREGPLTNEELVEKSDYHSASGTSNELWHRALVDREKRPGSREYVNHLSEKGERELRFHAE